MWVCLSEEEVATRQRSPRWSHFMSAQLFTPSPTLLCIAHSATKALLELNVGCPGHVASTKCNHPDTITRNFNTHGQKLDTKILRIQISYRELWLNEMGVG